MSKLVSGKQHARSAGIETGHAVGLRRRGRAVVAAHSLFVAVQCGPAAAVTTFRSIAELPDFERAPGASATFRVDPEIAEAIAHPAFQRRTNCERGVKVEE